jgi:hypothetical protein
MNLRVLYRLRFIGEQHPLDLTSFQYCLPLALQMLSLARGSEEDHSEVEEQITLALEFISFHANLCNEPFIRLLMEQLSIRIFQGHKSFRNL